MWRNNASGLIVCLMMLMLLPGGAGPAAQPAPPASPTLDLYYIGNRQSAIEPCGCRTKEQGGVELEAILYDSQPGAASLRVDAGEWSTPYVDASPLNSLKSRFLLRALGLMNYDAINVGISDLELSSAWFADMTKKYPAVMAMLVSANIYETAHPDKRAFPATKILTRQLAGGRTVRIGVTGVTSTQSLLATRKEEPVDASDPRGPLKTVVDDYEVRSAGDCLEDVVAALRPDVDLMLLLNAGGQASSEDLAAQFPEFDAIITTRRPRDIESPMVNEDGVLILDVIDTMGKIVSLMRLVPEPDGRWSPAAPPEKLLVSLDLPVSKTVGPLMAEFKTMTQQNLPMPQAGVQRIFAGAQRCMSCHLDEYRQWRATPHAHALDALVAQGEQFNPACLPCHVVGYGKSNGFYNVTHSPSLLMDGVQCESCHGPSAEHSNMEERLSSGAKKSMSAEKFKAFEEQVKASLPLKTVPESVCVTCHDAAHDPAFNYQKALSEITH